MAPGFSRALSIIAASVLAFDGAALAAMGWWSGRILLAAVGIAFFASSGLILLYWQRQRRRLDAIADLRRALAEETREMQRLLREK